MKTFKIDSELHHALKVRAAKERTTVTKLIATAVKQLLMQKGVHHARPQKV